METTYVVYGGHVDFGANNEPTGYLDAQAALDHYAAGLEAAGLPFPQAIIME